MVCISLHCQYIGDHSTISFVLLSGSAVKTSWERLPQKNHRCCGISKHFFFPFLITYFVNETFLTNFVKCDIYTEVASLLEIMINVNANNTYVRVVKNTVHPTFNTCLIASSILTHASMSICLGSSSKMSGGVPIIAIATHIFFLLVMLKEIDRNTS